MPQTAADLSLRIDQLGSEAASLYGQHRYQEGLAAACQAYKLATGRPGWAEENVSAFVLVLNVLAALYQALSCYTDAEPLYLQAVSLCEKTAGTEMELASALNNLAGLRQKQGRYAEAEELYQRALPVFKEFAGENDLLFAGCLSNFGELYRVMGRYDDAVEFHTKALAIYEKAAPGDLVLANCLNNLGAALHLGRDHAGAVGYHDQGGPSAANRPRCQGPFCFSCEAS